MKFLGVPGVFDYAGPTSDSRLSPLSVLPSALLVHGVGVLVVSFL